MHYSAYGVILVIMYYDHVYLLYYVCLDPCSLQFAEWCLGYGTHGCRIPDRPYSLFEGNSPTPLALASVMLEYASLAQS